MTRVTGQKEEKKEKEKKEEKKFLHMDRLKKGASSSAPLDFGPCPCVLCAAKQSVSWGGWTSSDQVQQPPPSGGTMLSIS